MLDPRPTDPLTGRQLMAAVLVCLGVTFLLLALSGCSTDPQDGSGAACGRTALPGEQPPSSDLVKAAMEAGWADAVTLCPGAAADTFRPAVVWKMSDFWIDNAISAPGGPAHGTCASGVAWLAAGEIWVSLAERERVLPLVQWETKNMALLRTNGCGWQAYARVSVLDVAPRKAGTDSVDRLLANAVRGSQHRVGGAVSAGGADGSDVRLGEACPIVPFATSDEFGVLPHPVAGSKVVNQPVPMGVANVLFGSDVFQIRWPVVSLVPVNMVHREAAWPGAEEGGGNNGMDRWSAATITGMEMCSLVPIAVGGSLEDNGLASYPAEARDRIDAFIPNYWAPFFGCEFFCGKVSVSHVSLLTRGSEVRLGVDVAASHRAVSHFNINNQAF